MKRNGIKIISTLMVCMILSASMSFAASPSNTSMSSRVVYGKYYLVEEYSSNSKADRVSASMMAGILSQLVGLSPQTFASVTAAAYTALDMMAPPETIYYVSKKYMKITTDGYNDLYHMKYVTIITDSDGNFLAKDTHTFTSISPMKVEDLSIAY